MALFTDSSAITVYIVLGWGLPFLFVSPWIILKALKDNIHCWTTNVNSDIFWLIRGPIIASIVVSRRNESRLGVYRKKWDRPG